MRISGDHFAEWKAFEPRYNRGVLGRYAKIVSSSSKGAVTDIALF